KRDYKYVFIGEFTENGKEYEVIDLQPTDRSKKVFKIRLVVNKKTRSIKSWEIFEKNQNRFKYTINSIAYNIQVEDNFFNFDKRKYPNVNEVDLRD
ncbi:MAG: outer-membrane lipoprotein carrier protein LolA, partial [Flammeovirgaceae bacterium]|nr:outer-membrane lipoprotein carrier protein LolA [Flammeovirgaceae bacterium]MDW8288699.1 outer-membrane lipoprotein carrier protein LolA [Flammeovirgaceae bacterium]